MQTLTRSRLIGIVLLAASIVFLCFLATSLNAAFLIAAGALLVGGAFVLAEAARLVWRRLATTAQRQRLLALAAVAVIAIVAVVLAVTRPSPGPHPFILTEDVNVRSYSLALRLAEGGTLAAVEDAVIDLQMDGTGPVIKPPPLHKTSTVRITSRGWLLREAVVSPLSDVTLALPGGLEATPYFLVPADVRLNVKLQGFPKGSFYAARDATSIASAPYLDTETVIWTVGNLQDDIVFAYIPSPFHYLRPLLAPFVSLATLSQWLFGLIGVVAGGLITAYTRTWLVTIAQRIATMFARPQAKSIAAASAEDNDY
jgi:hypothetical protein